MTNESRSKSGASRPLVSIFMFVRNGAASIRRAVDSVLTQSYSNIEFVIQDAVSNDGTLEILRSYSDPRIKLISEPDDGAHEGLWRGLRRCTGDFVGSCLSDEELLPDAVERAVAAFEAHPEAGAITGDAWVTDIDGKPTGSWTSGPFNLVDYLTVAYSPYFVSSFFRRTALKQIGLYDEEWGPLSIEFELWCRLATRSRVLYVPGIFGKYASHASQLSHSTRDVLIHVRGRMAYISRLCGPGGFFDNNNFLHAFFVWGHARAFCNHAILFKKPDMAREEYEIMVGSLAGVPAPLLDGVPYDLDYEYRVAANAAWKRTGNGLPGIALRLLGLGDKASAEGRFVERLIKQRYLGDGRLLSLVKALWAAAPAESKGELRYPPAPDNRVRAQLYAQMALGYEARGRKDQALEAWHFSAIAEGLFVPRDEHYRADRKAGWSDASASPS